MLYYLMALYASTQKQLLEKGLSLSAGLIKKGAKAYEKSTEKSRMKKVDKEGDVDSDTEPLDSRSLRNSWPWECWTV